MTKLNSMHCALMTCRFQLIKKNNSNIYCNFRLIIYKSVWVCLGCFIIHEGVKSFYFWGWRDSTLAWHFPIPFKNYLETFFTGENYWNLFGVYLTVKLQVKSCIRWNWNIFMFSCWPFLSTVDYRIIIKIIQLIIPCFS